MALSALALVRLIRTLHRSILLLEIEASVRNYSPVLVLVNDDFMKRISVVLVAWRVVAAGCASTKGVGVWEEM